MALNTFPTTPSLSWSVAKAPNFATRMQRAVSGRELRVSDYAIPLYTFTLTYEVIRDPWDQRMGQRIGPAWKPGASTPLDELHDILEFFVNQSGATIPFMFYDYSDNTSRFVPSSPQTGTFAFGDGVTTIFQMCSPGLIAPVIPTTITSITPGGISYTVDLNTGLITFASAPGSGVSIGADFQYNYKVRFAEDSAQFENFAYQFWNLKQLKLVSVLY